MYVLHARQGKAKHGNEDTLACVSRVQKDRIKTYELPQRRRIGIGELRVALPWVIFDGNGVGVCFSTFR